MADMDDIIIFKRTNNVYNGITLADVGQKLVAKPFALTGACYETGDVDERHRRWDDLFGAVELCECFQALIRDRYDTCIWLDCRKWIVSRKNIIVRQRVEEGRLANIWQSDDAYT